MKNNKTCFWKASPGKLMVAYSTNAHPGSSFFILHVVNKFYGRESRKIAVFSGAVKELHEEQDKILSHCIQPCKSSMCVEASSNWSIKDILLKCQAIKAEVGDLDVLIFDDYTSQIIFPVFSDNEVGQLKQLAMELKVSIYLISRRYTQRHKAFDEGCFFHFGVPYPFKINPNLTLEMAGEQFGISPERIREIEAKALMKHLKK